MKTIRAAIVEDELLSRELLEMSLAAHCPQVALVGSYATAAEALHGINQQKPELVFMDISLDTLSGFDLLKRLSHLDFGVIFITSSQDHPIDAIRVGAIDYLSKPYTDDELVDAVNRVQQRFSRKPNAEDLFLRIINNTRDHLIPIRKIMYCIAENNFTEVYVKEEDQSFPTGVQKTGTVKIKIGRDSKVRFYLASETLKKLEERLPTDKFFRIHRSYCINRDFLKGINRKDGLFAVMEDGAELDIARDKKAGFYAWMGLYDIS